MLVSRARDTPSNLAPFRNSPQRAPGTHDDSRLGAVILREDRTRTGAEEHRREPQGVSRLPHHRDLRGRRRAARHRGQVDPRRQRQPARQLRARRRRARCGSTTSTSAPYSHRGYADHEPTRKRKLLLHRQEIRKLIGKTVERGMTLVPTRMYFKNGHVKVAHRPGEGQEGARQARDDQAPRGRSRNARGGQGAAALTDPW